MDQVVGELAPIDLTTDLNFLDHVPRILSAAAPIEDRAPDAHSGTRRGRQQQTSSRDAPVGQLMGKRDDPEQSGADGASRREGGG